MHNNNMNSDLYANSVQLDHKVTEKLKTISKNTENHYLTIPDLINENNTLKHFLYIVNQDRIVIFT